MRKVAVLFVLCLSALVFAAAATADTTIDTISVWNGSDTVCDFGNPNTATYGQVVTVPAGDTDLKSFTFELYNVPSAAVFRGEVYAWDAVDGHAEGSSLYESAPTSTTGATAQGVTFTIPGGVALTAGEQIVIFASVSKDYGLGSGQVGCWGATALDTYAGGEFVYINNGGDPSQWTTGSWTTDYGIQSAFTAHFSPPRVVSLWLGASPAGAKIDVRARVYSDGVLEANDMLSAISPSGAGPRGSQLESLLLSSLAAPLRATKPVTLVLDARTACASPYWQTRTKLYFGGAADSTFTADDFPTPLHLGGGWLLTPSSASKLHASTVNSRSCSSWQHLGTWTSPLISYG